MILDKEDHRTILLELLNKSAFPGQFAEDVVDLKRSVREAAVEVSASDSASNAGEPDTSRAAE